MPGHSITTRPAGERVRVELDGELIAESDDAILLEETGSPPRYYLPVADVRAELRDSATHSTCPWKGQASYYSIGEHEDVAWYYPEPKPEVEAIRGRVSFWKSAVVTTG